MGENKAKLNNAPRVKWLSRDKLLTEVLENIKPALIGYDIGAGIYPHDYLKAVLYVCVDPYEEYLKVLTNKLSKVKDRVYIIEKNDWAGALDGLKENSIDSLYLIDVIEHLPKEEGLALLKKTEKIVRSQIVIFTPLGFIKQETLEGKKDAWGLSGADYQEHKSGWLPSDFDNSWKIYGCKRYHITNNVGEELKKPFGAFWAIKNIENGNLDSDFSSPPKDVIDRMLKELPEKYFHLLEEKLALKGELEKARKVYNDLLSRHKKLELLHQETGIKYQNLMDTKTVRSARFIKKNLKRFTK